MARGPGRSQDGAKTLAHTYFPAFLRQREKAEVLDSWQRGEQASSLYVPEGANAEYNELVRKSPNSWARLMVTAVVQQAELTGIRMPGPEENMAGWKTWQRNRMDARQPALYRGSSAHGLAYVWSEPSTDPLTGAAMNRWHLESAMSMAAFYEDDAEWARFAIKAEPIYMAPEVLGRRSHEGWSVILWDETNLYRLQCKGDGLNKDDWTYIDETPHGAPVPPVVQYAPNVDINGRADSDLQGMIPLLERIDQDTFDRLIVQRFGAWKIRWIAGMESSGQAQADAVAKIKLRLESLLIAENSETKFGTLDATDLEGFIKARDSDLRDLSALSQTPPHHMLGLASNLQAESLAAAEAGLQRKSREHRMSWGESHEQLFQLDAYMRGDTKEADAFDAEVRWRDTESRSLEQAAMALGMLATNLKVPYEMLWERIPGWNDTDVQRAKELATSGALDKLLEQAELAGDSPAPQSPRKSSDTA